MAMYPDENEKENERRGKDYIEINCFECGKFCGHYYRQKPTFFEELFFCSFKCRADHLEKEEKKKQKISTKG